MAFLALFMNTPGRAAAQGDSLVPRAASVDAKSASWITIYSPFSGDLNRNSHNKYEYSTTDIGPWTEVCAPGIPLLHDIS